MTEQAAALAAASHADDNEPPMLAAGARLALAQMQARAGQHAVAEKTYREDLVQWPASGWALQGLSSALQAQGRSGDAARERTALATAWPLADGALKAAAR